MGACRMLTACTEASPAEGLADGAAHLLAKLTQGYPDELSSLHAATRLALALSASPASRTRLVLVQCGCMR